MITLPFVMRVVFYGLLPALLILWVKITPSKWWKQILIYFATWILAFALFQMCIRDRRSDYLAIATLGIAEIILSVIKNEDWLARGVKNLINLPRPWPVPYEVDLQQNPQFLSFVQGWGWDPISSSTILVKLLYMVMFGLVLLAVIWLSERALNLSLIHI